MASRWYGFREDASPRDRAECAGPLPDLLGHLEEKVHANSTLGYVLEEEWPSWEEWERTDWKLERIPDGYRRWRYLLAPDPLEMLREPADCRMPVTTAEEREVEPVVTQEVDLSRRYGGGKWVYWIAFSVEAETLFLGRYPAD